MTADLERLPDLADGTCMQVDPDLWHPEQGAPVGPAKRICAGCPVREPCLEYALANPWMSGVWGGTSGADRRRLRAAQTGDSGPIRHRTHFSCGHPKDGPHVRERADGHRYCGICRRQTQEDSHRRRTVGATISGFNRWAVMVDGRPVSNPLAGLTRDAERLTARNDPEPLMDPKPTILPRPPQLVASPVRPALRAAPPLPPDLPDRELEPALPDRDTALLRRLYDRHGLHPLLDTIALLVVERTTP